jgi:hypothetical protein
VNCLEGVYVTRAQQIIVNSQTGTDFLSGGSTEMTGRISSHSHSHTTVHAVPDVPMSNYGYD